MPQIRLPSGRDVDLNANPAGSTQGIPSNIPVNHPAGWDPAYGGVPEIPSPDASAAQSNYWNQILLPALFSTGNAYNLFNYDQRMGQVQGTPGFAGVASNLAGQLPQDVVNQLAQQAAQRGVLTGGAPDSPNLNAAYLSSIGRNSLQQQQLGQQQLNSLLGQFQQAAPFNLMSGLVTSEEEQAARNAANTNAGAPNPRDAAMEEQRKLLEAIEAGKRAAGAGPVGSGGIDVQKIIDAFNAAHKTNEPGVAVGKGPNQTVNRGNTTTPLLPPNLRPYVDPGATGLSGPMIQPDRGRPTDIIQNSFQRPDLVNANTLGGLGIDPVLNAILGGGGVFPGASGGFDFGPTNENAYSLPDSFGTPITAPNLSYDNSGYYNPPQNNTLFGAPITSNDLFTGQNNSNWWEDPENLFSYEDPYFSPSDIGSFGSPITSGGLSYGGNDSGIGDLFGSGGDGDILDFLDMWG